MRVHLLHRIHHQMGNQQQQKRKTLVVTFIPAHLEEEEDSSTQTKKTNEKVQDSNVSKPAAPANSPKASVIRDLAQQSQVPPRLHRQCMAIITWLLASTHFTVTLQGLLKVNDVIVPHTNLPSIVYSLLCHPSSLQFGEILILKALKRAPLHILAGIPAKKWTLLSP